VFDLGKLLMVYWKNFDRKTSNFEVFGPKGKGEKGS